jgi:uncharacterized protein
MSRARRKTAKTTADYAMPLDRLDPWLQGRAKLLEHHRPAVSCLSGFDGFVTAIVAGPVSMPPPDWICPLLGVDPDAFNHHNEEFSAIAATAMRHNAISDGLARNQDASTRFYAAMKLYLFSWSKLLQTARLRSLSQGGC